MNVIYKNLEKEWKKHNPIKKTVAKTVTTIFYFLLFIQSSIYIKFFPLTTSVPTISSWKTWSGVVYLPKTSPFVWICIRVSSFFDLSVYFTMAVFIVASLSGSYSTSTNPIHWSGYLSWISSHVNLSSVCQFLQAMIYTHSLFSYKYAGNIF